ncbi:MAG: ATPase domain-containing protein [Thermoplasmata archaeon]
MEKILSGIEGLDELLDGGIPKGHSIAVIGKCGTGKTTFGLQFISQGLKNGEKGIIISLEEDLQSILSNSENFNWDLKKYYEDKKLLIIKLNPEDSKDTFLKVSSDLEQSIKSFGATRILFDSASLFTMLFDTEDEKRTNIFKLMSIFKKGGATTIYTSEADVNNPISSKDGLVEYVVDGVIVLEFLEKDNKKYSTIMRILKMRGTKHSRDIRLYEINSGTGIKILKSSPL